jgi:Peptidoglycan-synthase activator LpoB
MESEKKNRIGSLRRYRLPEEFYLYCLMALLALVSMAVVTQVRSETIVVEAQGRGPSRSDAISSALVAAVEQASGLQIEANSVLRQELSSISNGAESKHNLTGTHQMEVLRHTGGIVKSYEIISVESATDGSFNALLRVDIQRYSSPGLQTQDRRRIVVALPLNLASAEPSELAVMRDALNSYLVQTRRFAVLDRENDATYRKEMELLESPDVPLAETVRIGQVIGADYILLSKIRELEAASDDQALPITGRKVSRNRAILSSDFEIIEVASREVKWAGKTVTEIPGTREAVIRAAAADIGQKIVNAIFPLRVVQITHGTLVVNQGSDTIKIGQSFLANMLGEPTTDPYTKEPLGRSEIPIGTVRISRVDPKLSYGELISGTLPEGDVDIILRPLPPEQFPKNRGGASKDSNGGSQPKW